MKPNIVCVFSNTRFSSCDISEKPSNDRLIKKIQDAFEDFKFECKVYKEFKYSDIMHKIKSIKDGKYNKRNCIVIIILSHGDRNDNVLAADDETYSVENDVIKALAENDKLTDKPVLVFVEVSRGPFHAAFSDALPQKYQPANVLKCYFAAEGYVTNFKPEWSFLFNLTDDMLDVGQSIDFCTLVNRTIDRLRLRSGYVPNIYQSLKIQVIFER